MIPRQAEPEPKSHPISDASKLLWERFNNPILGAIQSLNSAILNSQNMIGAHIIKAEGFDPERHSLDVDKMVIIPRKGLNSNG